MINYRIHMIGMCVGMLLFLTSYSRTQEQATELKHYPLDSLEGILTQSGVELDQKISSDGKGSLKISAEEPTVVHLFETGDLEVEEVRLLYQAKLRTENVEGQVFLEMWCHFPGKGEFFSRGLQNTLSGTTTLFAFDKDQGLSEHTAPFDAIAFCLEGEARVTVSGKPIPFKEGEMVIMPAHKPHALKALEKFKMLLIMIRA